VNSVYCLEFDSTRIITGSRDKTIKVWSLATGHLLGTIRGHSGSVLCLKFDKDWDAGDDVLDEDSRATRTLGARRSRGSGRPGFMVSGSSDCSVCVWDLYATYPVPDLEKPESRQAGGAECEVHANVRRVLKGHSGGVLDLRIDERWIVSW
jgi:F-box and WD-40 domain protein 1/11